MIFTDRVHMIATTVEELHRFAQTIGLHKCYYRNPRKKRHPHYDLMNEKIRDKAIANGAIFVGKGIIGGKKLVELCRKFYGERIV